MNKVRDIVDLIPKGWATEVKELPKGKPLYKSICTNGAFRQITYIFKQGVFIRNIYKDKQQIFMKRPEIVNGKGDFLR